MTGQEHSEKYVNPVTGCSGPCCLPPDDYIDAVERVIADRLRAALDADVESQWPISAPFGRSGDPPDTATRLDA